MAANTTTPDGYKVNADGQWVNEDGVAQYRQSGGYRTKANSTTTVTSKSSGSGSGSSSGSDSDSGSTTPATPVSYTHLLYGTDGKNYFDQLRTYLRDHEFKPYNAEQRSKSWLETYVRVNKYMQYLDEYVPTTYLQYYICLLYTSRCV